MGNGEELRAILDSLLGRVDLRDESAGPGDTEPDRSYDGVSWLGQEPDTDVRQGPEHLVALRTRELRAGGGSFF